MATAKADRTAAPGEGRHKYQILPPLAPEDYAALKGNIALHGVKVPIVRDEEGTILDGFARAEIAGELGYDCPETVESGLSEADKRALVRALNLSRRQLGQAAKREVIAGQLRETPRLSNRRIARVLGSITRRSSASGRPCWEPGKFPGSTDWWAATARNDWHKPRSRPRPAATSPGQTTTSSR
jgi:hypothetical protein